MTQRAVVSMIAVAALMAGCSREPAVPPAQPETAQAPGMPQATAAPPISYTCESGQTVMVQYPDTATAQITYNARTYALRTVPAASGARYAGTGLEWWTASHNAQETAILSRPGPDQDAGASVLERCSRPTASGDIPGRPAPMPTPPAGDVLPAALPCKSNQLKLSMDGGDAGMGHRLVTLAVQNTGPQACSITGYPTVTLLDGSGRSVTTVRIERHPGSYLRGGMAATPVNLLPEAKGYFDLAWTVVPSEGAGEKVCPSVTSIRFSAPGDISFTTFAQALTPCGGRMDVSPIRPTIDDAPAGSATTT